MMGTVGIFLEVCMNENVVKPDKQENTERNGLFPLSKETQERVFRILVYIIGTWVILSAFGPDAHAQTTVGQVGCIEGEDRLHDAVVLLLTHLEGNFGALVMITAGIGAVISSAVGQYRAALGLLVVAIGSFILRTLIDIFFNLETMSCV
jgi:hypothetical protein